jgi:hypothetical protein
VTTTFNASHLDLISYFILGVHDGHEEVTAFTMTTQDNVLFHLTGMILHLTEDHHHHSTDKVMIVIVFITSFEGMVNIVIDFRSLVMFLGWLWIQTNGDGKKGLHLEDMHQWRRFPGRKLSMARGNTVQCQK